MKGEKRERKRREIKVTGEWTGAGVYLSLRFVLD